MAQRLGAAQHVLRGWEFWLAGQVFAGCILWGTFGGRAWAHTRYSGDGELIGKAGKAIVLLKQSKGLHEPTGGRGQAWNENEIERMERSLCKCMNERCIK